MSKERIIKDYFDSWDNLYRVRAEAKKVFDDPSSTQDQRDQALDDYNAAWDATEAPTDRAVREVGIDRLPVRPLQWEA